MTLAGQDPPLVTGRDVQYAGPYGVRGLPAVGGNNERVTVGVNVRALAKPNPAGVSRYTRELLRALAERAGSGPPDAPDFEYLLFGVESVPDELAGYDRIRSANEPAPAAMGIRAHLWEQVELPLALRIADVDVFHTPAGLPPTIADVPLVTTVHDVSPIRHPEWFSTGYAALYRVLTPLAVRQSDRLIAVSEFTRRELVETFPRAAGKTIAVPNGVGEPIRPADAEPVDGLAPGFLLFVGSTNPRKNLATLLDAYRHYRRQVEDPRPLVLAGPDRDIFASSELAQPAGVRTLGYVSDEQLAWLYRQAGVFVFPSLYEGFGLPVVEAMQVGTPVVTADRGATAEVAGDAARLVDPTDPAAIADGLVDALADRSRLAARGRDRAGRFTWARAAELTETVYREAVSDEIPTIQAVPK